MTVGKSSDLAILALTPDSGGVVIPAWLGAGISGQVTTSTEAILGDEWEQASVHAQGQSVQFSTVYDVADLDAALSTIFGSGALSPDDQWCLFVSDKPPTSWELLPVDLHTPGRDAPETDAITRPWSGMVRGRGYFGTGVAKFDEDTTSLGISSLDGTAVDDAVIILVVTAASGVTEVTLTDTVDPRHVEGFQVFEDTSAAADLVLGVTGTGETFEGYVLVGRRKELPDG